MNKRPLCVVGVVLILCIWLLESLGILCVRNPRIHPDIEAVLESKAACEIMGQIYDYEETSSYVVYSLKNSYWVHSDQKIPLKNIRVYKKQNDVRYLMGMTLRICGHLEQIEGVANAGQFDARSYYAARNMFFQMQAEVVKPVSSDYSMVAEWGYHLKCRFQSALKSITEPAVAGILEAMLCGEKENMEEDWKVRFQMGGISHITAISGLHLSLLGMGLFHLLCKVWVPVPLAGIISGGGLMMYCIWTGSSISATRALIMFLVAIAGRLLGRTYDMLSALALAGITAVCVSPASIYDSGFLLSYVSVLGIGILLPAWEGLNLPGICKGGIAIFLITCPITLCFFYEISSYGIVLNLLVLPTVGIVLVSGLLGGIFGMFFPFLGKILVLPGSILLYIYDKCCEVIGYLPGSTWILGRPSAIALAVYYMILGVAWYLWKKESVSVKWKWRLFPLIGMTLLLLFVWKPIRQTEITFLDVGQGDCAVVTSEDGNTYVVDGGSSSQKQVGKYIILPFLKYHGVRRIEYWLISHTDMDHISGVTEILQMIARKQTSLQVKKIVLPYWEQDEVMDELETAALEAGCAICYIEKGAEIREESLSWYCLHPGEQDDIDYTEQTNAGSQVWLLEKEDFRVMFTGDVEGVGEELLVKRMENMEIDVLKVAHHGSKNSTTEEFLQKIRPKAAVISCGEKNMYGHPHEETLERLIKYNVKVFNTMEEGQIKLRMEKKELQLFRRSKTSYNLHKLFE